MIYDFYAEFQIEKENLEKGKEEVYDLIYGKNKYGEIKDVYSRALLLITAYARDKLDREAKEALKALIHSNRNYDIYIQRLLSELSLININTSPDISCLVKGSWIIEFPITLRKPYISKDDTPFYIIENPIRKDKTFPIPYISSMAWKGNLRWTMIKTFLEPIKDKPEDFANIRFRFTLLFGSEKGWMSEESWTKYLDEMCENARELYRKKLAEKFANKLDKDFKDVSKINIRGMLHFYPTFLDRIDMIVINPHDRKTKTGRKPIHFEVVPKGAKGVFRLVYVPFHWIELKDDELIKKVVEDLDYVVRGLKEMMLTYGFSAKKSSGFGVIESEWDRKQSRIEIYEFYEKQKFGSFNELEKIVERWKNEVM